MPMLIESARPVALVPDVVGRVVAMIIPFSSRLRRVAFGHDGGGSIVRRGTQFEVRERRLIAWPRARTAIRLAQSRSVVDCGRGAGR